MGTRGTSPVISGTFGSIDKGIQVNLMSVKALERWKRLPPIETKILKGEVASIK